MRLRRIRTLRLELVIASSELFRMDLEDHCALGKVLEADIPASWPPELMDEETLREFIELSSDPAGSRLSGFYWVLVDGPVRTLVGNGGLLYESAERRMLGYSVLDDFQGRGLATEAVAALLAYAFEDPVVETVAAYTYPILIPSIRVLEKNGFVSTGPGPEPNTLEFLRARRADGCRESPSPEENG
jgi:RimJ/RimL family protein N-acetyltransferase